jgi:hypothetical protein
MREKPSKARGFTPAELGTFLAVPPERVEAWCREQNVPVQPTIPFEEAQEIVRRVLEARADEQRNEAVLDVLAVIRATSAEERTATIISLEQAARAELREIEPLTGSAEWTTKLHLRALTTTDTHINDLALHKVAVGLKNKEHGRKGAKAGGRPPITDDRKLSVAGALKRKQRTKKARG